MGHSLKYTVLSRTYICIFFIDVALEWGWTIAVVESVEELQFIQRQLRNVPDQQDFFIGGSTYAFKIPPYFYLNFSEYRQSNLGKCNST